MRTLIAEDELTARTLLSVLLSSYGACDVATNGQEALACFVHAHAQHQPYDLICLDIFMPELDGQQTLQNIRQLEQERGLFPGAGAALVLMTTSMTNRGYILDAFRDQCDGYLVKPIGAPQIQAALRKLHVVV